MVYYGLALVIDYPVCIANFNTTYPSNGTVTLTDSVFVWVTNPCATWSDAGVYATSPPSSLCSAGILTLPCFDTTCMTVPTVFHKHHPPILILVPAPHYTASLPCANADDIMLVLEWLPRVFCEFRSGMRVGQPVGTS